MTRAILVTNLTASVTEKQLSDFFSFCGKIVSLSIRKKAEETEAVLYFERESATNTALLLNKAIIDGAAIKVQPYTEAKLSEHVEEETLTEKINLEKQNPDQPSQLTPEQLSAPLVDVHHADPENITDRPGERSATAAIASMISGGYVLALDALTSAKRLDEERHISQSFHEGAEIVKAKAKELDSQLHVSETAENIGKTISTQWGAFDSQYKISENAAAASTLVGDKLSSIGNTIAEGVSDTLQTPAVANTLLSINTWGSNVSKSIGNFFKPVGEVVSHEYNQLKEESARQIAEKKHARGYDDTPIEIQLEELTELDNLASDSAPNVAPPAEIPDPNLPSHEEHHKEEPLF